MSTASDAATSAQPTGGDDGRPRHDADGGGTGDGVGDEPGGDGGAERAHEPGEGALVGASLLPTTIGQTPVRRRTRSAGTTTASRKKTSAASGSASEVKQHHDAPPEATNMSDRSY